MKTYLKSGALFGRQWSMALALWFYAVLLISLPLGALASGYLYPSAAGLPFVTERSPDASRVPSGAADFAAVAVSAQPSFLSETGRPKAQHMQISISKSISSFVAGPVVEPPVGQVPEFVTSPTLTPASGVAGTVFALTYGTATPQTALLSAVLTIAGVDVTADIDLTPDGMSYTAPLGGPKGEMIWQVRATSPSGSVLSMPVAATVSSGTTVVNMGAVTFTLSGEYETGVDAAGKPFVVVPSGIATLTNVTPVQSLFEGAVINGLMKNPVRTSSSNPDQGYDGRWTTYDPALSAGFPLSVTAGDVLVKTVARTPHENRKGAFDEIAALHVVASAPPVGAYLAPSVQWEGYTGPAWHSADIDAFYAGLTRHSASGHAFPPFAVLMQSLDQFYPLYAQISAASGMGYENASPFGFGGGLTNYGRYTASTIETAMLALVTDVYSEAETKAVLRRLVQHGIEWGDPMIYGPASASNGPDGGHHQFHQGPVALALAVTGRSADLPLVMDIAPGNWAQAFEVDAAWRTLMADPVGPAITRYRTLGTQPGGPAVRFDYESHVNGPDWYQTKVPAGARIVRVSDGVSVLVTVDTSMGASNPKTGTYDMPVDVVSPFAAGDVVRIEIPEAWIAEGLYDWTLRGPVRAHSYSPTASNQYRDLQRWGSVMALRSMGIAPANMGAVEGYLTRAGLTGEPTTYNDYPPVTGPYVAADGANYSISPAFYNQHWSGLNSGGGNSGGGFTPDPNVTLTFDTALTPQAQATSMVDGIVIGLVPGANTAPVRFKGAATGIDEIEIRIRRQSGGTVQDWTPVAISENGTWDGVLNLPRADGWWAADARPVNNPSAVETIAQKFAVGYKFLWLGQSQMSIAAKGDHGVFPLTARVTGTASYHSWQEHNVGGQYSEAEQIFVLEPATPGSDAVRAFVDQFRAYDPDTPVQILRESVNGTGILEMLDDGENKRLWSDFTNKTDKYGGDVSVVLENWNTANASPLNGDQDLDLLNGLDNHGFDLDHALPDVLQPGYVYAVQPATRHSKVFNDAGHAFDKVARANVLGYPVGFVVPDYETEDFGGPHPLPAGPGNMVKGARMALVAAEALGLPAPAHPHFPTTATLSADATLITLTPVLPNGGTLSSPNPNDLRIFAVDYGTGLTTDGFTARIAANGTDVELVRTGGQTFPAANFLKVQAYANGPLNSDLSGSGQTLTEWRALETGIVDGQLYESFAEDVTGRGLPVMGIAPNGVWELTGPNVPIIPVVTQAGAAPVQSALSLISEHLEADTTVAGAAEGYKRERLSAGAVLENGTAPAAGSKYLIGAFQIAGLAAIDKYFDQVEVRNVGGTAIGETLEIAMTNSTPGGNEMRVQAFVHTDTGAGRDLYAKSTNRKLMSYLPVYKINGFTTAGATTATGANGSATLNGVPAGSAIVVFAQNRDGADIIWSSVAEDGAHSLSYEGADRYQAVASGVASTGGTVVVGAEGAEEMLIVVLPPV